MNQKTFISTVGSMPALRHSVAGEEFDINKSACVDWIMARPGFKDWVWAKMRATGRLVYDQVDGTWHGIEKGPRGPKPKQLSTIELDT